MWRGTIFRMVWRAGSQIYAQIQMENLRTQLIKNERGQGRPESKSKGESYPLRIINGKKNEKGGLSQNTPIIRP